MAETNRTPHPQLKMFQPDSMPAEMAVLMAAALQVIAHTASGLYVRQSQVVGGPAWIDFDAMARDAGNLAVQIQAEMDRHIPESLLSDGRI